MSLRHVSDYRSEDDDSTYFLLCRRQLQGDYDEEPGLTSVGTTRMMLYHKL